MHLARQGHGSADTQRSAQPGKAMGDLAAGIGQTLLATADTVPSMRIS
jgi:hypothetical protein